MREIKFEYLIIHKPDERVLKKYIFTLDDIENGKASFALSSNTYVIRRQYTGLKDKNEVEIFEGDIVKNSFDDENYQIKFKQDCFVLHSDEQFIYPSSLYHHIKENDIQVIGNIYENQELLKGEK